MLNKLKDFVATIKTVIKDCMTSANGDYDPARVIGYGVVVLGALEFLILFAYTTLKHGVFDAAQFTIGLSGVSGALAAAAAGVWLKKTTEIPTTTTVTETVKPINPGGTQTEVVTSHS